MHPMDDDARNENIEFGLASATKKFEDLFGEVLMGLPQYLSQTGEAYIEFTNDGPRGEGEISTVYDFMTDKRVSGATIHFTEASSVAQWLDNVTGFVEALSPKEKTLYWRIKPETAMRMVTIQASNGTYLMPTWGVYSRFLISDKPRKD